MHILLIHINTSICISMHQYLIFNINMHIEMLCIAMHQCIIVLSHIKTFTDHQVHKRRENSYNSQTVILS